MARGKKTMIGFDPLAWLDEEGAEKPSTKKKKVNKTDKLVEKIEQTNSNDSDAIIEATVDGKLAANNNELQENNELIDLNQVSDVQDAQLAGNEISESPDGNANKKSKSVAVKNEADNNVMIENDQSVLHLHSTQDIGKSQMLKNDILALIHNSDEISIEASTVERIDGSALQLLCALFQYSKNNNLVIHWLSPSEALLDSAEILGIKQLLELN